MYELHNKREPAMAAAGQIALGVSLVGGMFQDALEDLLTLPQIGENVSLAVVQGIVDNANQINDRQTDRLKEALDIITKVAEVAQDQAENYEAEILGYENQVRLLRQRVAQLEADLEEAAGGNSSVRLSIPKVG